MKTYQSVGIQDDIMKALREGGGLILTQRQEGKTTCLLRYMMETPNCVLVVPNVGTEDYARMLWRELHGCKLEGREPCGARVPKVNIVRCNSSQIDYYIRGMTPECKVLVDEYFLCRYRWPFYAAVATVERFDVVPFHGGGK